MPDPTLARFTIHADRPLGTISPLWFGHNIEHTRSCVWRGLSAQMLRNRKFAGKPEQLTGQAMGWYPIGIESALFVVDGDGYVRRQDPNTRGRWNEVQHQRIYGYREGVRYGIGQDSLPLRAGERYEVRVVLRSPRAMDVALRVLGHDGAVCAEATIAVAPGDWVKRRVEFTAPADDDDARLEISFVGAGELSIGCVSLLPADNLLGMRRDVIGLLREIGAPLLRWPGGNFAGDYRWRDGLLDVDQRAPLQAHLEIETLPHTAGYDTHEVGTDEFIALCREVGAEPFISINLAWDEPEDAAAWVQYCNGAATTPMGRLRGDGGHPEPYGVRYWSLGNELGYQHMEGPNDAAGYARRARAVAEAMRRADPSIVLVASGAWWDDVWYRDCLANLHDVVDHISHHWYQSQYVRDYAGPGFAGEYGTMVAGAEEWQRQMTDLRRRINAAVPADRHIGVSFDEWNNWYAWYRTPGAAEGMFAAAMLDAFCHRAAEFGMSLGCYFEPVNEGAIAVRPHDARLTGIGQVMALFRAHHGNTLVQAVADGDAGPILLTASTDADGGLVLALVNKSYDTPARAELRLEGTGGAEIGERVLLRADSYLPGSTFTEAEAEAAIDGRALTVTLPPMSLARLRVDA